MKAWRLLAGLGMAIATVSAAASGAAAPRTPEQIADAALRAAPVWDGHNDVPEQLRSRRKNILAGFDFHDTTGTADAARGKKNASAAKEAERRQTIAERRAAAAGGGVATKHDDSADKDSSHG